MYIADLHIHSKYSRATSGDCDLPHLDFWAGRKGIGLVGTGDFTHPVWRAALKEQLVTAEESLYTLAPAYRMADGLWPQPRFVLSAEISCIYKKSGSVRKVHNVILLPDIEAADKLSERLEAIGNVHSDGRPILGLDTRDLLEITLSCCPGAVFIPAHIWTPHFSLFGAFSGFDTIEECFGDLTPYVRALETGLSSDPPMNRRVAQLDRYTLVSNSDAHSPAKLGREANLIDAPLSYAGLKRALETGEGFSGTIEFYPEEGKYHLDGHRNCGLRLTPSETAAYGGICPICGKKITIGVLNRVERLASRPETYVFPDAKPFERLIPLREVIGSSLGISAAGHKAEALYESLLHKLGSEFDILRSVSPADIRLAAGERIAEGISRLRRGEVICLGGFDGEYGTVSLFTPEERQKLDGQLSFLAPTAPLKKEKCKPTAIRPLQPSAVGNASGENAAQAEAIESAHGVTAVIAGPGTGKTFTLTERIARLIEKYGARPEEITAVTFTNQAAAEMRQRLRKKLSPAVADRIAVGTFHSICLERLNEKAPRVLADRYSSLALAEEILNEYSIKGTPKKFLQSVSAVKNGLRSELPKAAFEAYCKALRESGTLDFDDLIAAALDADFSDDPRFTHLSVDEFQDVNRLQYALVKNWSAKGKSLFAIGDPDQSIYGFRGSAAGCFDKLTADFPAKTIRLTVNYRSTPEIVAAGQALISHNTGERSLAAHRGGGVPVRFVEAYSPRAEAIFTAQEIGRRTGGLDMLGSDAQAEIIPRSFGDVAVLCRTNRQLAVVEACLRKEGIPCIVSGREDYLEAPEVRGAAAFFRYLTKGERPSLAAALRLIWNVPADEAKALSTAAGTENSPFLKEYADLLRLRDRFGQRAEPPIKTLRAWAEEMHISSPAYETFERAAALYDDMPALLDDLLLGAEGDVKRAGGARYAADAVRLTTLHGAKGLEFPVVFICGATEGLLPLPGAEDIEEERRLLYVGLTRAREELILVSGGPPSPFIREIPLLREQLRPKTKTAEQLAMF